MCTNMYKIVYKLSDNLDTGSYPPLPVALHVLGEGRAAVGVGGGTKGVCGSGPMHGGGLVREGRNTR
jgi:hypothetical protein